MDKTCEIYAKLADQDLYLQLAEEAAELSQAAAKYVRALRNTNPTPKSIDDIHDNVIEELSDVYTVCQVLAIAPNKALSSDKISRWLDRLREKEEAE